MDLLAADLKLSLFISAAKCYKKDFLVNPFPTFYINNQTKDFDKLVMQHLLYIYLELNIVDSSRFQFLQVDDIEKIPPLEELIVVLMADFGNEELLSDSVINLLHWILIEYLKYDVQTIPKSAHSEILSLSKSTGKYQLPSHIFQINYRKTSAAEKKFHQLKLGMDTKFAYHGTKFYCMYSILNYGLQQHLNKTSLFGNSHTCLNHQLKFSFTYESQTLLQF